VTFGIMKKSDPAIVMTEDGFYFEDRPSAQVFWSAIRRITTHKIDLLTTDEIRLACEHDDSELIFEVSEKQPGFDEFKRHVERRFAFPADWWEAVMKPAFATNSAVLFSRAEQSVQPDRREDAAPG
jgi:hypothetical protein